MAVEIERKFLVDTALLGPLAEGVEMSQGYISTGDGAVVRVRLAGERAWLTLKGPAAGFVRSEFEYPIPAADARQMIAEFCGGRVIRKTRYLREVAGYVWEIDVFAGDNAGLIVAEVELSDPAQQPPLPDWVGLEVTGDTRYRNNNLYTHPYCDWSERGAAEGRCFPGLRRASVARCEGLRRQSQIPLAQPLFYEFEGALPGCGQGLLQRLRSHAGGCARVT